MLCDHVVDLLEDRADIAIRSGPLSDSRLVMRRLGGSGMVVVASPDYLQRAGTPKNPEELNRHNRLGFGFSRHAKTWPFTGTDSDTRPMHAAGNLLLGDGETMRTCAIAGLGLARLARFHVEKDIQAGRLVPVLEAYNPGDQDHIHAVFIGPGKQLPARVRVLLDFLAQHCRIGEQPRQAPP